MTLENDLVVKPLLLVAAITTDNKGKDSTLTLSPTV
jgi:hypothetical protein